MAMIELPHTAGCAACGPENAHGFQLRLYVDEQTGQVQTRFTPAQTHIGFEGIMHGGLVATLLDEAMAWAATWSGKRFCLCAEINVRFRQPALTGQPLVITAAATTLRPKLIHTTAQITDEAGIILATATAKFFPLSPERHREFIHTLVDSPSSRQAAKMLRAET